ncbi:MAG: class I SAM-dependent methyltransferase [Bacillota bacterium]
MGVKWYQKLYKNYGNSYENEPFVNGTTGEVDFIEKELNFDKDKDILDIGCGTGRHSVELGKRGYSVVGVDLSPSMIKKAESKLSDKLDVEFIVKDALDLNYQKEFDLTIILCEGAFSLMENDSKDYKILENAYHSLKNGGKLIITVLNAYKQLVEENENFDIVTQREQFEIDIIDDNGDKKKIKAEQRFYFPSEIRWRLNRIGFNKIDVYGCKLGEFSRSREFNKKDMEFLVIARKE